MVCLPRSLLRSPSPCSNCPLAFGLTKSGPRRHFWSLVWAILFVPRQAPQLMIFSITMSKGSPFDFSLFHPLYSNVSNFFASSPCFAIVGLLIALGGLEMAMNEEEVSNTHRVTPSLVILWPTNAAPDTISLIPR